MVFGGHAAELAELTAVFETLDFGENQSVLISGLRGAGKPSMLAQLQDAAQEHGWIVIGDDASSGLMDRVMETTIPSLLNELSVGARKRLTKLGIWQLNTQWEYVDRHRQIKPLLRRDLVALSNALLEDAQPRGILITIDEEALKLLVSVSQGYPYLVQLAGDFAWRSAASSATIRLADARAAYDKAIAAVERRVISRVYQDLSEMDQRFVTAMAMDDGRSKISDIVQRLGVSDQYVQVYKKRLIASGYVQADGRGFIEFSLPYLGDYVRSLSESGPSDGAYGNDWEDFPPPRLSGDDKSG